MTLDLGLADLGQRRRPPTRGIVLVDDHGPHALIKIMSMNDARHYAEFHAHARFEIPCLAAPHLRQRHFETERRFRAYYGSGFPRPVRISTPRLRFTVKTSENIFDHVPGEQPIDRRPTGCDRPLAYRLVESRQDRIDRDSPGEAFEQLRKAFRRHAMGGNATGDSIADPEAVPCQGAIGTEFARHARQKPRRADIGEETNA